MAAQSSTLYATNIRHMMADLTPEKDGQVNHDMEDDVIRGATVAHEGEITFPPPPPKVQAIAAKAQGNRAGTDARKSATGAGQSPPSRRRPKARCQACWPWAAVWRLLLLAGPVCAGELHAAFHRLCAGSCLCWLPGDLECLRIRCTRPLMAVTNAISSIIILGALMQIGSGVVPGDPPGGAVGLHGRHQYLRRLPRDPAHARHVPEILRR